MESTLPKLCVVTLAGIPLRKLYALSPWKTEPPGVEINMQNSLCPCIIFWFTAPSRKEAKALPAFLSAVVAVEEFEKVKDPASPP